MLNKGIETVEGPSKVEGRAMYLGPRLFVDLTTSVHLLGSEPAEITRVETRLASALLDAEHLNPFPVIMAEDGSIRALDMSTARTILSIWREQVDVPIRLRSRKGAAKVQRPDGNLAAQAQSGRPATGSQRLEQVYLATRVLFRETGKILTGKVTWAELSDDFLVRHGFMARQVRPPQDAVAPSTDPRNMMRQRILQEAQLVVNPTSRDFLWTAGLYSHCIRPRVLLELKSRSMLRIGCLLYDVIGVLYPEHNPEDINADVYLANTLDLIEAADMLLAISKWTRETSMSLAQWEGRSHQPIAVLPLGVDVPAPVLAPNVEGALRDAIAQRPFALVVGTVESRKNILHLLDVWDVLARSGAPPLDLVIVGKQGYGAEAEARHVLSHPLFDRHIFWLDSCPHRALMLLYRMSTVVLCPSLAEGWDLAVSEALVLGRPVIASDTSAHPEVGFGQALLLAATDSSAWADAIRQVAAAQDNFLPDFAGFTAPTWEQSGQHLIKLIEAHVSATIQDNESHAHPSN